MIAIVQLRVPMSERDEGMIVVIGRGEGKGRCVKGMQAIGDDIEAEAEPAA